MLLFEVWCAN